MRIAYIAPYQGRGLRKRRPILNNLALAANVKIEMIAELLRKQKHDVEIISQGELGERRFKLYPRLIEPEPFHEDISIHYSSALPVRFISGLWSSQQLLSLFKERHRLLPYDMVLLYNLMRPQVVCGKYAIGQLHLPVILEYEDDVFLDVAGRTEQGRRERRNVQAARAILSSATGGIAVSPHLLGQLPSAIPKILLRGVVDEDVLRASERALRGRRNWVVYSGTHSPWKGLEPLIVAWNDAHLPGWELHIAGEGEVTVTLEKMAEGNPTIIFHGLLNRQQNARLLGEAKIGINPHDVSHTPGNIFAFKIIEYLAAGVHCVTTPMGALEPELEAGITYMPDNSPAAISATLRRIVDERHYERHAEKAAQDMYGPEAVSDSLQRLLLQVVGVGGRPVRRGVR
jgi:glycosyltransferase involved in cell wall biosynthesis